MKDYQEFLREKARHWGSSNPGDADTPQQIVETLVCPTPGRFTNRNRIELYQYKDQWGYALQLLFEDGGQGWGPYLKFSRPYASRHEALQGAVEKIEEYVEQYQLYNKRGEYSRRVTQVLTWAKTINQPRQLSLFETSQ